jgi:hypothetical protein
MCSFMVKFLFAELDHKVTEAIFQTSISFFLLTAILLGYKVTETSIFLFMDACSFSSVFSAKNINPIDDVKFFSQTSLTFAKKS